MPKLKLKRTPAEERERELRRARKATKRAAKRLPTPKTRHSGSSKHEDYVFDFTEARIDQAKVDDEAEYGPQPATYGPEPGSSSTSADYDRILRDLEDRRFREKLADALEDDGFESGLAAKMDTTEARMNDYAHVPRRWRSGGMHHTERLAAMDDEEVTADPTMMDDDEYAEWVRAGMWRRTHSAEYAAAEREKQAHAERLAHERAVKEDMKHLAREAEEHRRRRRAERSTRHAKEARERYEDAWKALLGRHPEADTMKLEDLTFADVPWPVFPPRNGQVVQLEDLTPDTISMFLLPAIRVAEGSVEEKTIQEKARKDALRETMLRFHPDKFEGRVLTKVREVERELVKDGVGRVVRAVGELMNIK